MLPTTGKNNGIMHGIGKVGKVISPKVGIIWWVRKPNHFESVWFQNYKTFWKGNNLHDQNLNDFVQPGSSYALHSNGINDKLLNVNLNVISGDTVSIVIEREKEEGTGYGTKWQAKQCIVKDDIQTKIDELLISSEENL